MRAKTTTEKMAEKILVSGKMCPFARNDRLLYEFHANFDLAIDRGRLRDYVLGDQLHEADCWSSGTLFSPLGTYCRICVPRLKERC